MRSLALLLVLALGQAAPGQSPMIIEVKAPGYSPRHLADVLSPPEFFLNGAEGVQRIRGLALDGRYLIRLDLTMEADPQDIRKVVQSRIAWADLFLPPSRTVQFLPQTDSAFMLIALEPTAKITPVDLSKLVKKAVSSALAKVPDVAQVQIIGGMEEHVRIMVDPEKLKAYKLSPADVMTSLEAAEKKAMMQDLEGTPISSKGGKKIVLSDVASVKTVAEPAREEARISARGDKVGTRPAIFVLVQMSPGQVNAARKGVEKACKVPAGVLNESRLLHAHDTTVVMRFPDGTDRARQEEKAQAAVTAMMELPQVGKVLWIAKPGEREAIFYIVAEPGKKAPPGDGTMIAALIKELDSDRFAVREAAQAKLAALGQAAEPLLRQELAGRPSAEVHGRIEKLLAKFADDAARQERKERLDLQKALRAKLARIEGASSRVGGLYSPLFPWPGEGSQFVARLRGKDLDKLQKAAEKLHQTLSDTRGFVDVDYFPRMRQEVSIVFDGKKMAPLGMQLFDILGTLQDNDLQPVSGWPWQITLSVHASEQAKKQTVEDLRALQLRIPAGPPGKDKMVRLSDVATIKSISAATGILRDNGKACAIVFGNLDDRTLQDARTEIRRLTQDLAGTGIEVEVD